MKAGRRKPEKWFVTWARVASWVFGGLWVLGEAVQLLGAVVLLIEEGVNRLTIGQGVLKGNEVVFLIVIFFAGRVVMFLLLGFPALVFAAVAKSQARTAYPPVSPTGTVASALPGPELRF